MTGPGLPMTQDDKSHGRMVLMAGFLGYAACSCPLCGFPHPPRHHPHQGHVGSNCNGYLPPLITHLRESIVASVGAVGGGGGI